MESLQQYKQIGLYDSSTPSAESAASASELKEPQQSKVSAPSALVRRTSTSRLEERMRRDLDTAISTLSTPTLEVSTEKPSQESQSSSEGSLAKPSVQQESGRDLWIKLKERYSSSVLESFKSSSPRLSSLKTLKVSPPMTGDALLRLLPEPLMNWGIVSNGSLLMQDISYPKEERESTLSDIVVPLDQIGNQCFLSPFRKRKLFALDYLKKNALRPGKGIPPGSPHFKEALKITKELCRSHQTMKGSDPDISDLLEKLRQRLSPLRELVLSEEASRISRRQSNAKG